MVCYKCGQNGHFKRECPNGKSRKVHRVDAERKTSASLTTFTDTTDYYGLLDVSGSMNGNRLEQAKNTFRNVVAEMGENDRISIVTFDSNAYFKLKPRPVGQIRRQNELEPLLDRIYARNLTAIWDAIYLTVSQIRDKNRRTVIVVLTDGEDNSSSHTYQEVLDLLSLYSNIELNIVHVTGTPCERYENICRTRGHYQMINETEIEVVFTARFNVRTGQVTVQQPVLRVVNEVKTEPIANPPSQINVPEPVKLKSTFYNCHLCNRKYKTATKCLQHFTKDHGLPENHPVPVKV